MRQKKESDFINIHFHGQMLLFDPYILLVVKIPDIAGGSYPLLLPYSKDSKLF